MPVRLTFLLLLFVSLTACIKDYVIFDTVDPVVQIAPHPDTLALGDSYLLQARYLNEIGREENLPINWSSTDPAVLEIEADGLATGISMGSASVIAQTTSMGGIPVADTTLMVVDEETSTEVPREGIGSLRTTSSYQLEGDFTLQQGPGNVVLSLAENYKASSALPGLYVYLTNNPNSIADALEISEVTVFSGAHEYTVPGVGVNDYSYVLYYCKPFNVKVGDGEIE